MIASLYLPLFGVAGTIAPAPAPASAVEAAAPADPAPVVEAERAFARAAREQGLGPAFRSFVAPDGIVFAPDPRPARPVLDAAAPQSGTLTWWPVYAGIAASGDLGFTTGPYVMERDGARRHGNYFTIWRRQPDGSWRWVLDHGPANRDASPLGPATPVATLAPAAPAAPRRGETGLGDVVAADAALAAALAADAPAALGKVLADDGRVLRQGPQPAVGRAAFAPLLAAGPARIVSGHLSGGISAAGDLAYTYGWADWLEGEAPKAGHYVRVWQRRAGRWTLIVDELIPAPPSPPQGGALGAS